MQYSTYLACQEFFFFHLFIYLLIVIYIFIFIVNNRLLNRNRNFILTPLVNLKFFLLESSFSALAPQSKFPRTKINQKTRKKSSREEEEKKNHTRDLSCARVAGTACRQEAFGLLACNRVFFIVLLNSQLTKSIFYNDSIFVYLRKNVKTKLLSNT